MSKRRMWVGESLELFYTYSVQRGLFALSALKISKALSLLISAAA
ncbi:MAG: hypothetical protein ACREP9_03410 [Candidatus Dormibacteraceae bacterium]